MHTHTCTVTHILIQQTEYAACKAAENEYEPFGLARQDKLKVTKLYRADPKLSIKLLRETSGK